MSVSGERKNLLLAIRCCEGLISQYLYHGDLDTTSKRIQLRRQEIERLTDEIEQIHREFEEAPNRLSQAKKHLQKLKYQLIEYDNKDRIERLIALAKDLVDKGDDYAP